MSNYTRTNWINGTTPISQENLNKMEQGISDAHSELESHKAEDATLTTKGHVQLQTTVDTTETKALTPKALNNHTSDSSAHGIQNKADRSEAMIQYGLNSINIDTTRGNWITNISEGGHGTMAFAGWNNVMEFEAGHFVTQIATQSSGNKLMAIRTKYTGDASFGAWATVYTTGSILVSAASPSSFIGEDAQYQVYS